MGKVPRPGLIPALTQENDEWRPPAETEVKSYKRKRPAKPRVKDTSNKRVLKELTPYNDFREAFAELETLQQVLRSQEWEAELQMDTVGLFLRVRP